MGLAVSILASALLISAQTGDPLASGIQLYDQRAFAEALQSFTKALDQKNTPRERARIHMYIGLIQVHYELVDDARASFEAAIARDARVALPSQADARARKLFRELKKDAPEETTPEKKKRRKVRTRRRVKAGDVVDDAEPEEELVEDEPEPARGSVVVAMGPTDPPVLTPPPAPPPALEPSVVQRPPPPREPEGGSNHVSAWIAAGTGGVATVGGVVFAVLATSTSNASLDEPVASKAATLHDKALGQRTISIVGFVVAGAALGTAAVLYFTDAP